MADLAQNQNKPTNRFTEMHQFISAPMIAVLNAEMMAAQTTVDFIEKVGFVKNEGEEEDSYGNLKYIHFTYQKPGTTQMIAVKIPVLSLVPIPLLQVKRAEFEFGMTMVRKSSKENKQNSSGGAKSQTGALNTQSSDNFSAAISSNSEHSSSNMKVKVEVEQSDIPAGLAQLFNLMESGVSATTAGKMAITIKPKEISLEELQEGVSVEWSIQILDENGNGVEGVKISADHLTYSISERTKKVATLLYRDQHVTTTDGNGNISLILPLSYATKDATSTPKEIAFNAKIEVNGQWLSARQVIPLTGPNNNK